MKTKKRKTRKGLFDSDELQYLYRRLRKSGYPPAQAHEEISNLIITAKKNTRNEKKREKDAQKKISFSEAFSQLKQGNRRKG